MKRLGLEYILEGTGGTLYARAVGGANPEVASVEIDNRRMKDECLFFCIVGAKVDAHTFLPDVRERGCRNIVVSDASWAAKMAVYGDMNIILVEDTLLALDALTIKYMDDWKDLRRVAVTGSAGKTTTKEFAYSVLSSRFRTGKNLGNYNSETGIPLTVFNTYADDIEIAIAEIGIGGGRYMAELTELVRPENAIITNVGTVHMEYYESSREKLLEEKLMVTSQFGEGSTLVVNNCEDNLSVESIRAHSKGNFNIVTVGNREDSDFRITDIEDRGIDGVRAVMTRNGRKYRLEIPVIGAHNLFNAAEAIALGELYGIPVELGLEAVKNIEMAKDRLDVRRGRYTVINDTYNANPEAMKAGIEIVRHTEAGRKGLIIGDMRELGKDEKALHEDMADYIACGGIDFVVTVGELGKVIADRLKAIGGVSEVYSFADVGAASEALPGILRDGDLFLVKASNSLGLNRIVNELDNGYNSSRA